MANIDTKVKRSLYKRILSLIPALFSCGTGWQGGAGHFVFPAKGKRVKIFSGKGRIQFPNRAIKTKNKAVFGMKEYFGSQKIKENWQ